MSIDELNRQIELLCDSKAEEYRMLGYEQVVGKDIWRCVSSKYKNGYPLLHVVVNDILSLKPDKFMNWLMMEAYRG
ncbi:post-transcriptional regulator [Fodinisporobacter ferrooxydans]|uniref:Post-transcriptional regulator n=2 Tax=Fodinisporobacter ferrooxydans TaxID=2901836 RepID=A0ABY4CS68_9BACL|nr:post-transcriptional regulator [Alicyclobacillaceae bacterium MYW30-H2]